MRRLRIHRATSSLRCRPNASSCRRACRRRRSRKATCRRRPSLRRRRPPPSPRAGPRRINVPLSTVVKIPAEAATAAVLKISSEEEDAPARQADRRARFLRRSLDLRHGRSGSGVVGADPAPRRPCSKPRNARRPRRRQAKRRDADIMEEVDRYLWEVYQRKAVKSDSSGDFTWKDPAAAKHAGMSMQEYVIRRHGRRFPRAALSRRPRDGRPGHQLVDAERLPRRLPAEPRLRLQGPCRQLEARRQPRGRRLRPRPGDRHHHGRRRCRRRLALDRRPRQAVRTPPPDPGTRSGARPADRQVARDRAWRCAVPARRSPTARPSRARPRSPAWRGNSSKHRISRRMAGICPGHLLFASRRSRDPGLTTRDTSRARRPIRAPDGGRRCGTRPTTSKPRLFHSATAPSLLATTKLNCMAR